MKINAYDAARLLREALEAKLKAKIDAIEIESYDKVFLVIDANPGSDSGKIQVVADLGAYGHRLRHQHARLSWP